MLCIQLMVEVDVFWSWAFGAGFAACSWKALQKEDNALVNRYSVYNILFLSVLFNPSGAYLLSRFPGWESMFYMDQHTYYNHPMLPTMFASSNVFLGVIAFLLAHRAIRAGNHLSAFSSMVWAYTFFFAILGMGYSRFLYAGTAAEYQSGKAYKYVEWFQSEVFFSLLGMGVVLLPFIYLPQISWLSDSCHSSDEKWQIIFHCLKTAVISSLTITLGFVATVKMELVDAEYISEGSFGWTAPLVGFYCGMIAFVILVLGPLMLARPSVKQSEKKNS